MTKSPKRFAELLTNALYRIKSDRGVAIGIIEDDLGFALHRNGAEFIRYLRKGNVPAEPDDVEMLARELIQRDGLDRQTCLQFLRSAGYPMSDELIDQWFESANREALPIHTVRSRKSFVVGPPILQPSQFFGRTRELRRIFGCWYGFPLEHMAVIGPRRSGKTSLLHYVSHITMADPSAMRPEQRSNWPADLKNFRWIFVDFQDSRMRRLDSLLSHLLMGSGIPVPDICNLDIFMDLMTAHDWNEPTIFLMDELGAGLNSPELTLAFWWCLRSLLNSVAAGNLAFLVAAPDSPTKLAEDRGKTSPFFNMFSTLELGPFTEQEACELISSSPLQFIPADVRWILEHSACWPCLIQILCKERLATLEEGDTGDSWKEESLQKILPFQYLLESNE